MTEPARTRLWVDGGLAAAWGLLVWSLGGDDFSAPDTSRILGPLLDWLAPALSPDERQLWLGAIRKLAHPVEYAVFAVLVLRFVPGLGGGGGGRGRGRADRGGASGALHPFVAAFAAALSLAVLDESRQAFVTSRTGSVFDVGLDALGALCGLVLAAALALTRVGPRLGFPPPPGGRRRPGSKPPPA